MVRIILFVIHFYDRAADRSIFRKKKLSTKVALSTPLLTGVMTSLAFISGILMIGAGSFDAPGRAPFLDSKSAGANPDRKTSPVLPEGGVMVNGRLFHRCRGGESSRGIARSYYRHSRIFFPDRLNKEIHRNNEDRFDGRGCLPGTRVEIPDPISGEIANQPLDPEGKTPVRAVYIRGENATPERLSRVIPLLKRAGFNGMVIDIKDVIGVINYPSDQPLVQELRTHPPYMGDLKKTVAYLHSNGIQVIARLATFQDMVLARKRPELAIRDRNSPSGTLLWKGKPLWVDPAKLEVHDYNLSIVEELVEAGVDEVQFDYIRYPAEGDLSGVGYHHVEHPEDKTRHIMEFLSKARDRTRATGVRIGIDIFGIVAWGETRDIQVTGQDIGLLSPYVDVISPMLYPSHFQHGYEGIPNPADHGYYFYNKGVEMVRKRTISGVRIRPWLQTFSWRVTRYDENYIQEQIKGSDDAGGHGWLAWNAANRYETLYSAFGLSEFKRKPVVLEKKNEPKKRLAPASRFMEKKSLPEEVDSEIADPTPDLDQELLIREMDPSLPAGSDTEKGIDSEIPERNAFQADQGESLNQASAAENEDQEPGQESRAAPPF